VWVIDNQAWDPETQFAVYGGKLFIGKDSSSKTVVRLQKSADVIAELLSRELQDAITVSPLLTAHGGRLPRKGLTGSGITLLRAYRLPSWMRSHGNPDSSRLTAEQIDAVTQAAIHQLPIGDHTIAAR
jgi:hypothetical protein